MHPYTDRGKDWGKCRGKHSPEISLILPKIHLCSLITDKAADAS